VLFVCIVSVVVVVWAADAVVAVAEMVSLVVVVDGSFWRFGCVLVKGQVVCYLWI